MYCVDQKAYTKENECSLFSYPTTIVSKSTCAEDAQLKLFILGDVIDK